jgi:hypothetical protein
VTLLGHIGSFLRPGGLLLLTTCCHGGSLGAEALNLWGAGARGAGRLPAEDELVSPLREAGYSTVKRKQNGFPAIDLWPSRSFAANWNPQRPPRVAVVEPNRF